MAAPSAPGFFGVFEAATKVALRVYGIDDTLAVSYALGYHLLSFIPITVIGFWYLGKMGLHLKELGDGGREHGGRETLMTAAEARVEAQAKVNLFLRVLAREASGYHQLETLFCRIALADTVTRACHCGRADRSMSAGERVPRAAWDRRSKNLAWRVRGGVRRRDRVPARLSRLRSRSASRSAGGLGGGSADAGAVLRALNALNPQPLPDADLLRIAAALGADVPFLTQAQSALALGAGYGERLRCLPALSVARRAGSLVPGVPVHTADAYRWLDESGRHAGVRASRRSTALHDWSGVASLATNDFEDVVGARDVPVGWPPAVGPAEHQSWPRCLGADADGAAVRVGIHRVVIAGELPHCRSWLVLTTVGWRSGIETRDVGVC